MSEETETIIAPEGFADGSAFVPDDDAPAEPVGTAAVGEADETDQPMEAPAPVAPVEPPAPDPQKGILRDLQAERQARQDAQQEAARLRGLLEGIQLEQRRGAPAAGPAPLSAAEVAKATTWAHRFGMYTADGQPDVQAAANALAELRTEFSGDVDQRVQARVQPVVQVLQQAQAHARVEQIVSAGSEYGADPGTLRSYAQNLAQVQPDALNDPNVVVGLIALVRGVHGLATPQAPQAAVAAATQALTTPPAQPNMTEAPGRRSVAPASLSRIEQTIASKRGMTSEKWQQTAKAFEKMDPTRGLVAED